MSVDFPMNSSKFKVVAGNSTSIFSAGSPPPKPTGAGLGNQNTMHGYLFHNGNKNQPHIFANLLKNGYKQTDTDRKRVQLFSNKKVLMKKLEAYVDKKKFDFNSTMMSPAT